MSSAQATELMLSQVAVASEAVGRLTGGETIKGKDGESEGKKIGLCLGPFGATLQPGQESVIAPVSVYGTSLR